MPRFTRYYEPSTLELKSLAFVKEYAVKDGLITQGDSTWARDLLLPNSELDALRLRVASRASTLGNLSLFIVGLFFFMQVLEIAGNFALGLAAMATPLFLAPGIAYVVLICRGNFSLHTIVSPENLIFRRVIAAVAILSSAVQFIFVIIQNTVFCDPTNPLYLASSAYQQLCGTQRVVAISAAVLSGIYLVALFVAAIYDLFLARAESQYTSRLRDSIREYLGRTIGTAPGKSNARRVDGILLNLASIAAKRNADILEEANYDGKRSLFFYIPYVDDLLSELPRVGAMPHDAGIPTFVPTVASSSHRHMGTFRVTSGESR